MKVNYLAILMGGSLAVTAPAQSVPILTGPIEDPANGYSYYLLASSDWTDAESQALSMGGNLATVADAADNQWILDTFADYGGVQRFLWIGLYDPTGIASDDGPGGPGSQHAADFVWADGQPYNFSNWTPGEPNDNGSDEYYVEMFPPNTARGTGYPPAPAGTWNDVPNSAYPYDGNSSGNNFGPVFGVVEVPEPGSFVLGVFSIGFWFLFKKGFSKNQSLHFLAAHSQK